MAKTQRFRNVEWPQGAEAILVGCWWLLREIELASLKGADFGFSEGPGCGWAEVTIRASKADTEAAGCTREHACICPSGICPVKAARALTHGKAADELVLQNKGGSGLSKRATVRLLKAFASSQDCDTARVTGHSMRTSGAQHLADAGLSTEQIKMFGRWGSTSNMAKYTREAHIRPGVIADALI